MNLLKQTALILGLTSLSIFAWTLYKSWRKKIAIEFAVICICVAIWSLAFVAYVTLNSRIAYDIHRFFNIWLSPIGVVFLGRFLAEEDWVSKWLRYAAWGGAIVLSLMVTFSVQSFYDGSPIFRTIVRFWPALVFFQFVTVVYQDAILKRPVSMEFISTEKRTLLYFGVAFALTTCSFDHIPEFGFIIPSIGNLLFTVFLVFASQVVSPQKFLRAEALISRFFATLILALVITGFFALMFQYVSDSFPLFLLNSFLLSFATLVLWNPLVTLFRYGTDRFLKSKRRQREERIEDFRSELHKIASLVELKQLIETYFKEWIDAEQVRFLLFKEISLPEEVERFFLKNENQKDTPILHRQLINLEIEQELTEEYRKKWTTLLRFLDDRQSDIVFPVMDHGKINALVLVKIETTLDDAPAEWSFGFASFTQIYLVLQEVNEVLKRLFQIEEAADRQRLTVLGEMAAGLAHEVRNPLGAIRGAAELLDENSSPWAKVIKEEVQRLNRLVSQFLDLSHVSTAQKERCDLENIIRAALKNMQFPLEQAKLRNETRFINVVPDHVQQILINLVQNALHATQQKIEKVSVNSIELLQDGKRWVGFEVVDQGIGIAETELSKVLQPFYTTFKEGTGLGLSICDRLVKLNDGILQVSSRVNEGTRVRVYLPYVG